MIQEAAELARAAQPAIPSHPIEWGVIGAIAVLIGKGAWELILKLIPGGNSLKVTNLSAEDRARLDRLEGKLRTISEKVARLDDAHSPRKVTGEPVWYCSMARHEQTLAEIHHLLGRVVDEQRQHRGLMTKLGRSVRHTLNLRKPKE